VDDLVDLISRIAGKTLVKRHDLTKPQGVRGRNSDNARLRDVLGWEPPTPLSDGLRDTYGWIESQLREADLIPASLTGAAAKR
jgi:nucleoside-diphosphate-sugar epimerase